MIPTARKQVYNDRTCDAHPKSCDPFGVSNGRLGTLIAFRSVGAFRDLRDWHAPDARADPSGQGECEGFALLSFMGNSSWLTYSAPGLL
jgi:hypothetical protein